MRYDAEHKLSTRLRIVEAAGQLFRAHGLKGVGVADVMKAVGLTHGGFYRHFVSRDALIEAVLVSELKSVTQKRLAVPVEAKQMANLAKTYLAKSHVEKRSTGCPIAALAADVALESGQIRNAFSDEFAQHVAALATFREDRDSDEALADFSLLVGAVILARACAGTPQARQLSRVAMRRYTTSKQQGQNG
jgi:TetR/AcrR family transcriptional regulator, transcriptional repressor for nem operon